jgi:EmrB/QacA subfamily drug resistance transporter
MSAPASSGTARPPRLTNPAPNRTLLVLAAGCLAYALAQTMIVPALPEIQRTFGGDPADATWLLTAFLLTAAVATPLLGRLGDMYGKEHWLLISLGVFGAGSVVSALAGSLGVMIAGRAIQGAGGAIFPLAIGIIRDEFPREKVATGIGTISAMFGIGGGVGLVIAGVLVDGIGVAWIFWLSAAAALIAAWATWKYVPESPVRVEARIDWVGAVLLSGALGTLLLGVSEGNAWGWTSAGTLGLFAASAALTAIWAAWEWRVVDPLVDLRLMRRRPVWTTNVAAFAIGFAMFGSFVLIPQLVQTPARVGYGFGASVTASGLFLLPSALVMLFAGPVSGRLGTRYGSKLPLALGAVFAAAGYFWLAALHDANIDIYLGSVLLGIGIGLAFAAMANLTVEAVPMNMTGIASAINAIMRQIGGAIGAQVAAAIVSAHLVLGGAYPAESGYTIAFAMSGVAAIGALFVTFVIPAREAPARTDAPAAVPPAEAAPAEAPAAEARA